MAGTFNLEERFGLGQQFVNLFSVPEGDHLVHVPMDDEGGAMDVGDLFKVPEPIPGQHGDLR